MSTNSPTELNLQIARLEGYSDKSGNNLVIVPTDWIKDCENNDNFKVKYMEPSGDEVDDSSIQDFVKNLLPSAPPDWPEYICYPQAVASSYNEALLVLNALKKSDAIQNKALKSTKPKAVKNKKNSKVLSEVQTNISGSVTSDGVNITSIDMGNLEANLKSFPNMEVYVTEKNEQEGINPTLALSLPKDVNDDHNEGDEYAEVVVIRENGKENDDSPVKKSPAKQSRTKPGSEKKRTSADRSGKDDQSSDEEFMSNPAFKKFVIKRLKSLDKSTKSLGREISNVATELQETKTFIVEEKRMNGKTDVITFEEFTSICKFEWPLTSMQDFDEFNAALIDTRQPEVRETLVKYLNSNISTIGDLEKNIRKILRKFIAKPVAQKVTAQKKMKDKIILDLTEFGKLLRGCFVKCYNNADKLNDRSFLTSIGNILNNVKDWEEGRHSS